MVRQRDEGKEDDTLCLRTRGEQDAGGWVDDRQSNRRKGLDKNERKVTG